MAALKVGLDQFARHDIDEISQWYEKISLQVRKRFSAELNSALRKIQEYPKGFPTAYKDFRKIIIRHFPYSVIYRIKPDEITVYAVIHMSRNPTNWLARIQ
ncbi:MAG: type II toxin-antitoxin system RelE/ParE family toxin [Candidatus Kapaibacterium sp.]